MKKSPINLLIVEDNQSFANDLKVLISQHDPQVHIIGVASNLAEATHFIQKENPELVFLDVELPDGLCFEWLAKINDPEFEVVFITAHDNYIRQLLQHYNLKILIKPASDQDILGALDYYRRLRQRFFSRRKNELLQSFLYDADPRVLLQVGHEHFMAKVQEIVKCEAADTFTNITLSDGTRLFCSKNLKYYEKLFENFQFIRVHRSVMVNPGYIRSIHKNEFLVLENGDKIPISIRKKTIISQIIKRLS